MSRSFSPSSILLAASGFFRHLPSLACGILVAGLSAQPILAAAPTTTSLTVSTTALAPGKPAKLIATVTDASNKPVAPGTVTFYDGTRVLGTAQLVSHPSSSFAQGTATLNIASFDAGANSLTAVFAGTVSYLTSTSPAKTLTVSGEFQTATTVAVSGSSGAYAVSGTVETFGIVPPGGSLDFYNAMSGASLGSLSLAGAGQGGGLFVGGTQKLSQFELNTAAVADFNGDGFLDMATGDEFALNVYLGKGDGTFQEPINVPVQSSGDGIQQTLNVLAADVNNDGIIDLIADVNGYILVALGNGNGTFQAAVQIAADASGSACVFSTQLTIVDFDRDGNLDLISGGENQSTYTAQVCSYRGNGDGTFKAAQIAALPSNQYSCESLVTGDLNGDSYPDVIAICSSQEDILLGKGDGTFQPPVTKLLENESGLALADLNRDGKLDLIVVDLVDRTVDISLGKGDGTFGSSKSYPAGGQAASTTPVILDINRDGKLDIAVTSPDLNDTNPAFPAARLDVLLGNGDGTFQTVQNYLGSGQTTGSILLQGDFNGDGLPDLLTTDFTPRASSDGFYNAYVFLAEKSSKVTLPGVNLPGPGTSVVSAQYTGDSNYVASTSCKESPGVNPQNPTLNTNYAGHIAATSASIGWGTTFPTNGYIRYGTSGNLTEQSPFDQNALSFHFVNLSGLTPATTYSYSVTSIAYFGGCAHWTTNSPIKSFTTAAN